MNFIEAIAAQNKDVPTVMPLDFFSYLLGKSQASPTKTITGTPPFTFKSNGDNLVDWSIKGNTGGVGERTKNLVDLAGVEDRTASGVTFHVDSESGTITITGDGSNAGQVQGNNIKLPPVTATTNLYMTGYEGDIAGVAIFCWDNTAQQRATKWDGVTLSSNVSNIAREVEVQLLPGHEYRIGPRVNPSFTSSGEILKPMLRLPDTSADFIPYGYEIPVTCGGKTTDIFIGDSPLGADDTITKTSTGVDIPTVNGSNTLSVDTTVQPSEMTITINRRLINGI